MPAGVGVRVRDLPRAEAHQPRGPSLLISSPFWLPVPMSPASFLAHTHGPVRLGNESGVSEVPRIIHFDG